MNKDSGCVYRDRGVDSQTWLRHARTRPSSSGHIYLPYKLFAIDSVIYHEMKGSDLDQIHADQNKLQSDLQTLGQ